MKDFIIVGRGLAATVLMHRLKQEGMSFQCIGVTHFSKSSIVAAGIYNPVVFKRLTKSWMAQELIDGLNTFYSSCEHRLNEQLLQPRTLIKPFTEEQEKNHWIKKSHNELSEFIDPTIYKPDLLHHKNCKIPNEYGCVKQAGSLNMEVFLRTSSVFFKDTILDEAFDYEELKISAAQVQYKTHTAKNIIFCEGHLVKHNPYFNWIPLKPAKGEVLTIQTDSLFLKNSILNRNGFLMDVGNNSYKLGATYAWDDVTDSPTENGKIELLDKLKQLVQCDYTILKQEAGVRPSSSDRRPIVGAHPELKNSFVLNGLGTKGVMLAPYIADNFVHFMLKHNTLHPEIDIKRFYHLYEKTKNN